MAAGAEADQLLRIGQIGPALVVVALQPSQIDEQLGRGRLAGQGR